MPIPFNIITAISSILSIAKYVQSIVITKDKKIFLSVFNFLVIIFKKESITLYIPAKILLKNVADFSINYSNIVIPLYLYIN